MTGLESLTSGTDNFESMPRSYNFGMVGRHEVSAGFDGEDVTSHAGLLSIFKLAKEIGFFESIAGIFPDFRSPGMIEHSSEKLIRQVLVGDLTGQHDFTDWDRLKHDPLLPVLLDLPRKGVDAEFDGRPGSKHSIQRLMDRISKQDTPEEIVTQFFKEVNKLLVQFYVASKYGDRAARRRALRDGVEIVLEIDASDIRLDGEQEGLKYNKYYGCNCYFMQMIYSENFPLGCSHMTAEHGSAYKSVEMIRETLENLRELLGPKFKITVRGDAAYGTDGIMSYIEERRRAGEETYFIVRKGSNSSLCNLHFKQLEKDLGAGELDSLRAEVQEKNRKNTLFCEFDYETRNSWSQVRRIRGRLDLTPKEGQLFPDETRYYVITNLEDGLSPEEVFKKYYERAVSENWIKELKLDFDGRHSSMSKKDSNAFRFSLKVFTQSLVQIYRNGLLKNTPLEKATGQTIRETLVNFGARVYDSYRRFHVSFAKSCIHQDTFDTAYWRIEEFSKKFCNMRTACT